MRRPSGRNTASRKQGESGGQSERKKGGGGGVRRFRAKSRLRSAWLRNERIEITQMRVWSFQDKAGICPVAARSVVQRDPGLRQSCRRTSREPGRAEEEEEEEEEAVFWKMRG